ncbi:hypothetical protein BUALT_Bualt19G0125500 [Buddleja alternifolia]|uniref:Beta-galactosidase n=1 Tax=Buddleja alternifolia TaxID=168488 RepID=A0AAV6W177_9LAMI|nr:hypothetical protein BUALT_Bualt19G0125500 [Buddleja alternifolia]
MAEMSKILLLVLFSFFVANAYGAKTNRPGNTIGLKKNQPIVTYDERSIIINGTRELLFSGSIHYPRSTPEMWPDIIKRAKEGGLNLIQTYVFWNIHEPVQGQYHMKKYTETIVNLMKKEKLFADQGGPIIMAQIENEYNNVQLAYREKGVKYVKWAADMAVDLYKGVPWVMCKQKDAPQTVISTCNGRQCGDTFPGPNGPNKPSLWTENWTAQYRVFGDSPSMRSAEDLSFAIARFFSKNGTLNNYYMYHGGTNFGRTSSSFVTTRYYDEAPLDEYGLKREPKFGHLRDLHRALRLSKRPLLWGHRTVKHTGPDTTITIYNDTKGHSCAAFLTNTHRKNPASITFRGVPYQLPPKSISIFPDCETLVYNTQMIVAQHSSRNFVVSNKAKITSWQMFKEKIPTKDDLEVKSDSPKELYSFTKDTSDYAWYSTSIKVDKLDMPKRPDIHPVLQVASLGHALLAFVNGEYIGFEHGSNVEKAHVFKRPITLKPGVNQISMLAMTVGFPNSGAFMERRFAGPRAVSLEGLMAGNLDITENQWAQQVGVNGEKMQLYTEGGSKKVKWVPYNKAPGPVTWYKAYFDAPEGDNPVAINMTSMAKGMIWVNGKSLGRYWVSYLSALQKPTQEEYHIPRSFLKPKNNLLVIFEETGGNPEKIDIMTVNRDTICSVISQFHPPNVQSWERKGEKLRAVTNTIRAARLTCPDKKVITNIEFVSFGNPEGACGNFRPGTCATPRSHKVVEKLCLGKSECVIPFDKQSFLDGAIDTCPTVVKTLAVQAKCGYPTRSNV